ncbi:uncharacterized protein METZ01_LOCUS249166, partial [marine metagenome]
CRRPRAVEATIAAIDTVSAGAQGYDPATDNRLPQSFQEHFAGRRDRLSRNRVGFRRHRQQPGWPTGRDHGHDLVGLRLHLTVYGNFHELVQPAAGAGSNHI